MSPQGSFEERLDALDTSLFDAIPSQTTANDRRSMLACQLATRAQLGSYRYLEIGSHLGGSTQPHLLDPACSEVISIDTRPSTSHDNSGLRLRIRDNSTDRMMANLSAVSAEGSGKVRCLDQPTTRLDPDTIEGSVDLCFVDAEHTDAAVAADFSFCRAACGEDGAIAFHDAQLVYNALWKLIEGLRAQGARFHAYNLPSTLLVIELGDFPLHRHPAIQAMLLDNHVGYLESLRANDHFR